MGSKRISLLLGVMLLLALIVPYSLAEDARQISISPTPASIILPSQLPLVTQEQAIPTIPYTSTPPGPALLEALTEANVRAEPDPESERLGSIRAGDVYAVVGRYYRWFQFQYDQSPTGTGWVFDELVAITGDETRITDLSENALPTADNTSIAETATSVAITQTPGGLLTATAAAGIIPLPVEPSSNSGEVVTSDTNTSLQLLPTFTYPPEIDIIPPDTAYSAFSAPNVTSTLTPNSLTFSVAEGIPPIIPILILGGLGFFGLIVTSYRR